MISSSFVDLQIAKSLFWKFLKFNQSECRLHKSSSQSEARKFCAHSVRTQQGYQKRGLSRKSKVSTDDIERVAHLGGGENRVSPPPPLTWLQNDYDCGPSFYQNLSIKKKYQHFLSFLLEFLTIYICYFSSVLKYLIHTNIYHLMLHKTWQPKKNNKKYNKDCIGLLGLLQNIRDKPLPGKQGQRDFDQKDYYGLWTDEIY